MFLGLTGLFTIELNTVDSLLVSTKIETYSISKKIDFGSDLLSSSTVPRM